VNWLNEQAWLAWVALAFILGAVEMVTLDLLFLMLAGGALVGAISSFFVPSLLAQALITVVAALGMLFFVRPVALRHLRNTPETRTGVDALIGKQAVVLDPVTGQAGRVKLAGEVWSARCYDPDAVIPVGASVDVISIEGATAVVHLA
jgi:membrane protein implicated in regulation of membrane protease activity